MTRRPTAARVSDLTRLSSIPIRRQTRRPAKASRSAHWCFTTPEALERDEVSSRSSFSFAHDLSANASRLSQGKPLHTFPDHALAPDRPLPPPLDEVEKDAQRHRGLAAARIVE